MLIRRDARNKRVMHVCVSCNDHAIVAQCSRVWWVEFKIRALSGGDEKQAATHSPRGFLTQVHTKHTPGQ
jgi:hypothetical protein